jgi:hypothetical protein
LQEKAFQGDENENPFDHLREFRNICETFGPRGLSQEFVFLKLFRWSLKGKAFAWLQSLSHHCITSWKDYVIRFTQKFVSFNKTLQFQRDLANFVQSAGETLAQAWNRFYALLRAIPNCGLKDYAIIQSFYGGLNDECRQTLDCSAGGSIGSLTVKQCEDLIKTRAYHDELYNPGLATEVKKGMLFITPELMPEVKQSMKEKGMPMELAKESKVDVLEMLVKEDEQMRMIQHAAYEQRRTNNYLFSILNNHKRLLDDLSENYIEMGHSARHLGKYISMMHTQCGQIAYTQSRILEQKKYSKTVCASVTTRGGKETQDPPGPSWYQEEQAQRKKYELRMSQENDLVDPQDDIELEAQRKRKENINSEPNT